jgi:hypothetical protein
VASGNYPGVKQFQNVVFCCMRNRCVVLSPSKACVDEGLPDGRSGARFAAAALIFHFIFYQAALKSSH